MQTSKSGETFSTDGKLRDWGPFSGPMPLEGEEAGWYKVAFTAIIAAALSESPPREESAQCS